MVETFKMLKVLIGICCVIHQTESAPIVTTTIGMCIVLCVCVLCVCTCVVCVLDCVEFVRMCCV